MKIRIGTLFLALLGIVSLCSCGSAEVLVYDLLADFEEDDYFSFYYTDEIAEYESSNTSYGIYHLYYDLNDDGTLEDLCYIVGEDDTTITVDIYDTSTGADIGSKSQIYWDGTVILQVLSTMHGGYYDLRYATVINASIKDYADLHYSESLGYYIEADS